MSGELRYITFKTAVGWVGILASARGLLATTLPRPSDEEAHRRLGERLKQAGRAPYQFADLVERLRAYFRGEKVTFADELDLSGATSFQREVWQITRLIPYGETETYLRVAERMGRPGAMRVVGQALAKNPLPIIIPCHRVVASNGKPGGFSGGVEMKRFLLCMEVQADKGK
ncbi:MAG: methylated-DNA--[protein]-cysteine S-methyltransferase [Dehalococcoidales bacterium]|nr:methylated-DNA--[protein]-cysteine S-methyltransferase [Dehalococcoidales bacterium]